MENSWAIFETKFDSVAQPLQSVDLCWQCWHSFQYLNAFGYAHMLLKLICILSLCWQVLMGVDSCWQCWQLVIKGHYFSIVLVHLVYQFCCYSWHGLQRHKIFGCIWRLAIQREPSVDGSVSRLRKGAGSNFEGARSIPYAGSATVSAATGILQGFSLRICMNLSGVNLILHTSHSNLQSTCRPEHWEISWQ